MSESEDAQCVKWREGKTEGWCATLRNAKPDVDALHDNTACGMCVTLRIGSEVRKPTCEDCRRIVNRKKR